MATARASVASNVSGLSVTLTSRCIMAATCSLEALPLPVTDCLMRRGEYSEMGMSRYSAAAMATPCARPNLSIDCTFLPKNGASMASSSG